MKTVNKSYKYRFYPTHDQKVQLSYSFGCARCIYNHILQKKSDTIKKNILTAGRKCWGCWGSPLERTEDSATIICCKAAFSELGIPWL